MSHPTADGLFITGMRWHREAEEARQQQQRADA